MAQLYEALAIAWEALEDMAIADSTRFKGKLVPGPYTKKCNDALRRIEEMGK